MRLLEDGIVAGLAAVGLAALLWLLFGLLFGARCRCTGEAVLVLPCRGNGAELEQTVRRLLRLRCGHGGCWRIVLLDRGLDEEGRQIAALLCRDCGFVSLCERDALGRELG